MMDSPPGCRGPEGPGGAAEPHLILPKGCGGILVGKSQHGLGWRNGFGQGVGELSKNAKNISFHNYEPRVSELSSDSGQMFQRGPWEQK